MKTIRREKKYNTMKVYLAGNLHLSWRDFVKSCLYGVGGIEFLEPKSTSDAHLLGGGDKDLYFLRDKALLRDADVILGVIQRYEDGPCRHSGLSAEVGMAYALGKTILLVNSMPDIHSFEFIEKMADSVFPNLELAANALRFMVE